MEKSKIVMIAMFVLIVGGINWGFVAFGTNPITVIFGVDTIFSNLIYAAVGASAFIVLADQLISQGKSGSKSVDDKKSK